VTVAAASEATAISRPEAGVGHRAPSAADIAALAAASCQAARGGVAVLTTAGPQIQVAHGFDGAIPHSVLELCYRVIQERRLAVIGDESGFLAGAPILTSGGDLLGVLWIADDAPRTELESHLEQLLTVLAGGLAVQSQLDMLWAEREHALDMVHAVVFYAGRDGVLRDVSSSWATLTGHAVDVTVGRPLTDFVLDDIGDPIGAVLSAPGDEARRVDGTVLAADGGAIPVELAVRRSRLEDGSCVVLGVVTDLRERHQRELAERHDHKMESLGRLSAGIAHEINTPIQFVGDNTRFLASALQEMLDLLLIYRECMDAGAGQLAWEERNARAARAEQEADIDYLASEVPVAVEQSLEGIARVASLVRAMKAFSYKDSRDRSYTDLNESLSTTLTVARNEVKYVADVTLDLGELPPVLCHAGDLNQVFLNLVVNAADAMQDKGERGEIRITTRSEGSTVVISIADNGCGIPESLQRTIFEPFFTTKELGKGTGQGLALARAVVIEKHGGTIDVRSAPGEGTEFVLRLPVDGNRPAAA
jgi:PAS domain S-box-containing protein